MAYTRDECILVEVCYGHFASRPYIDMYYPCQLPISLTLCISLTQLRAFPQMESDTNALSTVCLLPKIIITKSIEAYVNMRIRFHTLGEKLEIFGPTQIQYFLSNESGYKNIDPIARFDIV